tara:strand:+ start:568 stop:711 length:144 start_codon:yes stop_codon:yes gene_type:complete
MEDNTNKPNNQEKEVSKKLESAENNSKKHKVKKNIDIESQVVTCQPM